MAAIDWDAWRPVDTATLVFLVREGEVLLIRKKRGLGAGKINGPGGRLEPGETALDCAVREMHEEVGVTPRHLARRGENLFQFADGYSIHVHVFTAADGAGEAVETDEAVPLWTPLDRIPYHEMWEDDALWLPLALSGAPFVGRYVFEGERMLDYHLDGRGRSAGKGGA